jgi:hypothetical protein
MIHPTRAGLAAKRKAIAILDQQQAAFLTPLGDSDRRAAQPAVRA